jgi:DhnA family fructose-bisphosphate aldolase class Ia
MPINERAKVILAKIEATEGVDAVPVVATDAILTRNFSSIPLVVDTLERNLDLPTVGRSKSTSTNARQTMSFEVEIAGSGTAGTATKWSRLLQACGMAAPVVTAGGKVEQKFGVAPFY